MPGPLAHLSVVDLTDLRGALAGRLLADLGADVVKVEPPGGDPDRLRPPFAGGVPGKDRSLPFLYRNANKRGVTLDLHDAGGWRRFLGLCENADVLIENLGPDAARRHALPPTARLGADGRRRRAGGGAERPQPLVDPARRLRTGLSDGEPVTAAQCRRRLSRPPHRGRLRARPARHAPALAGFPDTRSQPRGA